MDSIRKRTSRRGFTLIELLIVISILLVVLVMTAAAVDFAFEGQRVTSTAQQVRSFLEGARDRAIRAKAPRGVRFLQDSQDPQVITGMAFIAPNDPWVDGTIQLERLNVGDTRATVLGGSLETAWWQLKKRGLLYDGLRVRIPNNRTGSWYTIDASQIDTTGNSPPSSAFDAANPFPYKLHISPPYRDPADNFADEQQAFKDGPDTYSLELPPRLLPEQVSLFPKGTFIDLNSSRIPASWRVLLDQSTYDPTTAPHRITYLDLMFSPRGTVTGSAASEGILHFYITDIKAYDLFAQFLDENFTSAVPVVPLPAAPRVPADSLGGEPLGDRAVLTLFTQTGAMQKNEIDPTDADANGIAEDPWRFAETSLGAN